MAILNSRARYGSVAMLLHWVIALSIIGMIALGLYMHDLPLNDPQKFPLYQLHKSIGLTILGLSVFRLLWRLVNRVPPLPDGLKAWERFAARFTHFAFYVMMIGIPLVGWAMVSASPWGLPTYWFGVAQVPHLPYFSTAPNKAELEGTLKFIHYWLAIGTLGLLALHVGAALKHHFILKDDVLKRMLPGTKVSA